MEIKDKCPVCQSKLDADAKTCGVCGTDFETTSLSCPLCDTEIKEEDKICPGCGAEFDDGEEKKEEEEEYDVDLDIEVPLGMDDFIPESERPAEEDETEAEPVEEAEPEAEPEAEEEEEDGLVDKKLEELVKLPGIGPLRAQILYEAGFTDLRTLKNATVVELMNIHGIGRKTAGEIKAAFRDADITEIKHEELKEEDVEAEYQCPLCGTIVSAFETSCYECGKAFEIEVDAMEDADNLALSHYDEKIRNDPGNAELWYARGATLVRIEEYEQALKSFDKVLEVDPSFQSAWMSKADVYRKLGDSTKAAECYGHIVTSTAGEVSDEALEEGAVALTTVKMTAEDVKELDQELQLEAPPKKEEEAPPKKEEEAPPEKEEEAPPEKEGEAPPPEPEVAETEFDMEPVRDPGEVPEEKESAAEIDFSVMPEEDLKANLSKYATYIKPLLIHAKEMGIEIREGKKLIAKGVAESKHGDLVKANVLLSQGVEVIEFQFRTKLADDIGVIANKVRELKLSGMDVSVFAEMISVAKDYVEKKDFVKAIEEMKKTLEALEKAQSA